MLHIKEMEESYNEEKNWEINAGIIDVCGVDLLEYELCICDRADTGRGFGECGF